MDHNRGTSHRQFVIFNLVLLLLLIQFPLTRTTTTQLPTTSISLSNSTDGTSDNAEMASESATFNSTIKQNVSVHASARESINGTEQIICQNVTSSNVTECSILTEVQTDDNDDEDDYYHNAQPPIDYVGYIAVPTFLLIGLVGNSMTIAVVCNKKFQSMSIRLVMIALSISDTLLIILHPHNKPFIRTLLGIDIRSQTLLGCKIFFLSFRTAKMSSSWFVVLLCLERFVAVVYPFKAKFVCTRKNAAIGIAIVYISLLVYNGVWTFASRIVNGNCVPHYSEPPEHARIFAIIGTSLYCLLPDTALIILTPIICLHLYRRIQMHRECASTGNRRVELEVKRTTAMLLGVSIAYIILVTPIGIAHLLSVFYDQSIFETKNTAFSTYRELAQVLEQLNYSINFFLYVLCSKSFRNRVFEIVCCKQQPGSGMSSYMQSSSQRAVMFTSSASSFPATPYIHDEHKKELSKSFTDDDVSGLEDIKETELPTVPI